MKMAQESRRIVTLPTNLLRNANLRSLGFSPTELCGTLQASTNQDVPCITISSQLYPSTALS